jgi:hypothetical protein
MIRAMAYSPALCVLLAWLLVCMWLVFIRTKPNHRLHLQA